MYLCAKGEAGTGNVVEAVRHCRTLMGEIRRLCALDDTEVYTFAKEIQAPYHLVSLALERSSFPDLIHYCLLL